MSLEVQTEMLLKWPQDRPRIRFQDRKPQGAWKLSYQDTMKGLQLELARAKATAVLITHNRIGHEDGGVAVWISRKPVDDYRWQDEFGFIGTIPSEKELGRAYMEKVRTCHPESPTPNLTRFHELTMLRDQGRRWIRGERTVEHESCMAVDNFKEVRHNLNAIKLVLAALRQIERCGSPVMTEQAWRGFRPALAAKGVSNDDPTAA